MSICLNQENENDGVVWKHKIWLSKELVSIEYAIKSVPWVLAITESFKSSFTLWTAIAVPANVLGSNKAYPGDIVYVAYIGF